MRNASNVMSIAGSRTKRCTALLVAVGFLVACNVDEDFPPGHILPPISEAPPGSGADGGQDIDDGFDEDDTNGGSDDDHDGGDDHADVGDGNGGIGNGGTDDDHSDGGNDHADGGDDHTDGGNDNVDGGDDHSDGGNDHANGGDDGANDDDDAPIVGDDPPQDASFLNVTLAWDAPTERINGRALSNLAGFTIHYGRSESDLDRQIVLENPGLSRFVIEDLSPGEWYFAMSAFDNEGLESGRSNVVSAQVQ